MSKRAAPSPRRRWLYAVASVFLLPALGLATDVQVVGVTPGRSVDVVIDGGQPVTIEVGETAEGVKVLSADQAGAKLRIDGITRTVPLGAYRGPVGGGVGSSVTVVADESGHFFTTGTVNGASGRFLVDTGATLITISRTDAARMRVDYEAGTPMLGRTANGMVRGWRVSLESVRVGGTTVRNVDAMVVDNDTLGIGLLGMSFLSRFDMHREGSKLMLRRRR